MADRFDYAVYGLRLRSDIPFAPLRVETTGAADVTVRRVEHRSDCLFPVPVYATDGTTASGAPYLAVDSTGGDAPALRIRQNDETASVEFVLRSPSDIDIHLMGQVDMGDLCAYFIGPVLGYLLRLRRTAALHGGFVATPRGAVGVIGPKGAGKSSLVAAWARAGITVLADDIGALAQDPAGRWTIASAYPRLRLWPDTATALGLATAAERVLSFTTKVYVDLTVPPFSFEPAPQPLRAILALGPRAGSHPVMAPLQHGPATARLLANVYAPAGGGIAARRHDMAVLGSVSSAVPVLAVTLPESFEWLNSRSASLLDLLPG